MKHQLLRVLIAADPANAEVLLREIQRGGYEVTYDQVQSAKALRAAAEAASWDLVLAADRVEGFSALDALAAAKATGQDLPVILIAGTIDEERVGAAMQGGAADILLEGRLARLPSAVARVRQEAIDRADRRAALDALGRSEAQHRSLIEHAVFGLCQAAADGRMLAVNPALVTMLGYPSADVLRAVPLMDLFVEESARVALLQRVKARAPFFGDEALWRPRAGDPVRVRLSGALRDAPDHGLPVFQLIVEDITEWQRRQDRLGEAQKAEAVGQLVAELAHDFTDPLTAILGYGELLTELLPAGAPGGKEVRELVVAAERAAVLARQLLAVSRKQPIAMVPLSLNDAIRGVVATLPRMLGESIQIKTTLGNDTGLVMADPHQVEQVIVNLALKARGAMPVGGVLTVESRAPVHEAELRATELRANASEFVLLRVSHAAPAKTPARAGEPPPTGVVRARTTGLGLAAVTGIVRRLGGAVSVEGRPGGTSVQVFLRRAERTARAVAAPPPSASASGQETVLLVEDEDSMRSLVRTALTRQGYTVFEARSAEGALELLAEFHEPVHLLLTDLVLGGMDGRQLAARMSADHPFMRTLLMSGHLDREEPQGAAGKSGPPLLEKPFTVRMLIQRVRDVLVSPVTVTR